MPVAISAGTGLLIAGGVGAAGAIGSSLISSGAQSAAGDKALQGQLLNAQMQNAQFQQMFGMQNPYIQGGYQGLGGLQSGLGSGQLAAPLDLNAAGFPYPSATPQFSWDPASAGGMPTRGQVPQFSWNPTQAGLEQTPGYQFTLDQGLKSVQNAYAARGLGVSGAALKGASTFASGLANSTYNQQLQNAIDTYKQQLGGYNAGLDTYQKQYGNALQGYALGQLPGAAQQNAQFQNQFADYWANQNNRYDQLYKLAQLGANTSVSSGTQGVQSAANAGNALSSGIGAQAAGIAGAGNALAGGINTGLQNVMNSPSFQNWLTRQFDSGGGGAAASPFDASGFGGV